MIVSFFRPHNSKKGRVPGTLPLSYDFTWAHFAHYLRECAAEPAPRSHKQTGTVEVNALGMAIYPDDARRGNDAALCADWIGLDIDDKGGDAGAWKFDVLVEHLTRAGVAFVAYTTTSCTLERHCLRLVLPFNRRVRAIEWPIVWASFAAWIGQVDPSTKDPARILYEPRCWEGAYNRFHASSPDLPFIDVDEIVEQHAPAVRVVYEGEKPSPADPAGTELQFRTGLDDFESSPIVRAEWVDEANTARAGGRMFRFLCRVALSAKAQNIALSDHELGDIGRRLATIIGRRDRSDIPRDAERALTWAFMTYLEPRGSRNPSLPPPWPWS